MRYVLLTTHLCIIFDVTLTMEAYIVDLWNMKPRNLVGTYKCFRDAYSISLQVRSKLRWESGWLYVGRSTHLIYVYKQPLLYVMPLIP
jgi:hypothetical protein